MTSPSNRLHLVVPGLLGPLDGLAESGLNPRSPLLNRLLARADRFEAGGDFISILFGLFGYRVSAGTDWPSAAVCRLADGAVADENYWLHADPVYLKPDMDRLLLSDARALGISWEEARELADLIERHFADEDWHLEPVAPQRWYLRLPRPPGLSTSPLHQVAGRSLFPFLPDGADASRWRVLLNEVQMLLHHADVNRRRREAGRPEINGLWLWGGGRLPDVRHGAVHRVFSDHPLAAGLARLADMSADALPQATEALLGEGECLVFRDDLFYPVLDVDPRSWCERLDLMGPVLETLVDAVRRKRMEALLLYPCNGRGYRVTRAGLRRFWRRSKPVAALLATHS